MTARNCYLYLFHYSLFTYTHIYLLIFSFVLSLYMYKQIVIYKNSVNINIVSRKELLSGHSTVLPSMFLDYHQYSCAHNLCFPSSVRKRVVRQRRSHNDAVRISTCEQHCVHKQREAIYVHV